MPPYPRPPYPPSPAPPLAPPSGGGLIGVGIAGAALQTLTTSLFLLSPGAMSARASLYATADVLLLLGALGLMRRRGSAWWFLCAVGFGLNLLASGLSWAALALSPGFAFSLVNGMGGLIDAAVYGLLGVTLIARRNDGQPGVGSAAAVFALARAGAAAVGALLPLLSFLGPDLARSAWSGWRLSTAALGVLLAIFFGTALGRRR